MDRDEKVPTKEDWGDLPKGDLDVLYAYKEFLGKTNQEMKYLFSRCVIEMADSLRWMPPVPFRYYMKGFADFVMSGDFDDIDASDVASTFLNLVEEKVRQQYDVIGPIMEKIFPVVVYLSEHQNDYGADPGIYGDFKEKMHNIEKLMANSHAIGDDHRSDR